MPVQNMFNKDDAGLNPLHYAYLYDLPDVRQILRQSGMQNSDAAQDEMGNSVFASSTGYNPYPNSNQIKG